MTNEHLMEIFSIYGPVATAEIEKDPRVGLSKGSAYVTFKKSKDMNQAMLHLDGAQLDGNVIKATFVLVANKRKRSPSVGKLPICESFIENLFSAQIFVEKVQWSTYLFCNILLEVPSFLIELNSFIFKIGMHDRAKGWGLQRRVEGISEGHSGTLKWADPETKGTAMGTGTVGAVVEMG